jgi:hypothetical protein
MQPHLEVLPAGQRAFWDRYAREVPAGWALYGGTAIALRFGHRQSMDFDFFSHHRLDEKLLRRRLTILQHASVLQRQSETLVCAAPVGSEEIRLAFFGGIKFGRVGTPDVPSGKFSIASPLDLLATKLKTILQRVEAKDYLDIEVLLRSGLTVNRGISATLALYPEQLNPLDIAKAVGWFKDGDLETLLPDPTRRFLMEAAASFDPTTEAMEIVAKNLTHPRARKTR